MSAPDADALLVERVRQGDVKAFEMLVVKYQRRIERLIGRMVRDVDLVPDIAQETFIAAMVELYNPAQRDVLARASSLAHAQLRRESGADGDDA